MERSKAFWRQNHPLFWNRRRTEPILILTDIQINAKNKLRVWGRDPQNPFIIVRDYEIYNRIIVYSSCNGGARCLSIHTQRSRESSRFNWRQCNIVFYRLRPAFLHCLSRCTNVQLYLPTGYHEFCAVLSSPIPRFPSRRLRRPIISTRSFSHTLLWTDSTARHLHTSQFQSGENRTRFIVKSKIWLFIARNYYEEHRSWWNNIPLWNLNSNDKL